MARKKSDSRSYSIILYPENEEDMKILEYVVENLSYYIMLHDKDINEDGEIKKSHYHVILRFENTRSIKAVSEELDLNINRIEYVRNLTGMVRYLVHADSPEKIQYDRKYIQTNMKIEHYFINRNDESVHAGLIIDYIDKYNITSLLRLAKWCHEKGMWTSFRRGGSMWNGLIMEKREEVSIKMKNLGIKEGDLNIKK